MASTENRGRGLRSLFFRDEGVTEGRRRGGYGIVWGGETHSRKGRQPTRHKQKQKTRGLAAFTKSKTCVGAGCGEGGIHTSTFTRDRMPDGKIKLLHTRRTKKKLVGSPPPSGIEAPSPSMHLRTQAQGGQSLKRAWTPVVAPSKQGAKQPGLDGKGGRERGGWQRKGRGNPEQEYTSIHNDSVYSQTQSRPSAGFPSGLAWRGACNSCDGGTLKVRGPATRGWRCSGRHRSVSTYVASCSLDTQRSSGFFYLPNRVAGPPCGEERGSSGKRKLARGWWGSNTLFSPLAWRWAHPPEGLVHRKPSHRRLHACLEAFVLHFNYWSYSLPLDHTG